MSEIKRKRSLCSALIATGLVLLVACDASRSKSGLSADASASPVSKELGFSGKPDYQRAALINVELGLGYLSQGQVARAKAKLIHAIKLAPNIAEPHSAMAHFLEMVGDFKDSEREHKKAISLSAQKGSVYNNYGAFLCRRTRYKEADLAFQSAIQDKDYARTAEVYENAGLCALKWGKPEKAFEYFTTAVRRDPMRSTALLELADFAVQRAQWNEAKKLLTQYKGIVEPNARSLWLGILVGRALHDDNAVASQGLMLKNLFEDSQEYQWYLGSEQDDS